MDCRLSVDVGVVSAYAYLSTFFLPRGSTAGAAGAG
jgi:hypothetical protein